MFFYLGSIILLTSVISWGLLEKANGDGITGWYIWPLGILIITSVSYLSLAVVNWLVTLIITPTQLPRFDYSKGIPPESRTLVVVPSMLANARNIDDLAEALEVRFLANQDENLHFGLLTDFKDALNETVEGDELLVELVSNKIAELNEKYPGENKDKFFLFHRPRKWNPSERVWMGYERKRGKLSDLNSLLRGQGGNFSLIIGKQEILREIRYVITLDADTQLPRDSARQFVSAMAHPLNKPRYDEKKRRVTEGYTILQPRVAVSLPGTNRSGYARLFGSEPGIDPYTRAVSDVYQDLFREGSFIGKGIYDVDMFERTLNGRFAENRILSHDLLEGCYSRSGLLSDVLLFEEYPARYKTDADRRKRWIRGDWQLIPWIFPLLPKVGENPRKNPLSLLSWWKIVDNLRRSIVPFALTMLLLAGWTVLSSSWFWTIAVAAIIFLPSLIISAFYIFQKQEEVPIRQHIKAVRQSALTRLSQAAFVLMSLPYEAFYSMDAILRTLWRLLISKKRLLEWNPAGDDRHSSIEIIESYRIMWISPFAAVLSATVLIIHFPISLTIAWPVIISWFLFPFSSWWISRLIVPHAAKLTDRQTDFLRKLSRKTWFFFETFVGSDDNWLPPDNYQEHPVPVIAHRTSPTNMGLSLLANLTAFDFGYIQTGELLERTENAFITMNSMSKFEGHFYNWYDTQSLEPLKPLYISSVDSGNLAGHLLTLQQGLSALPEQRILLPVFFEGIADTLQILTEKAGKNVPAAIVQFRKYLNAIIHEPPVTLTYLLKCLEKLSSASDEMLNEITDDEYHLWAKKLSLQIINAYDELTSLTPWILHPGSSDIVEKYPVFNNIPTLREVARISMDFQPSGNTGDRESEAMSYDFRNLFGKAADAAKARIALIEDLVWQSGEFARMEFGFLYDKSRHLQTVGYNVEDRRIDSSYYDLLASEARLSSFVAIAQDQVPQESWFALGRLLTSIDGEPVLLSWSGSMFEYLMPLIVMPVYENSLLYQSCRTAVTRQIEYGKARGVPWGISESGYNNVDIHQNYQYRGFGVPGLGLKRGLSEDLVISPYATALALMIMPEEACINLERLAGEWIYGKLRFL